MRVSIELLLMESLGGRFTTQNLIGIIFCSPVPRRWHRRPHQRPNWNFGCG